MRRIILSFLLILTVCFFPKIESSSNNIDLKNNVVDAFNKISEKILPTLDSNIKGKFESKMSEILNGLGIRVSGLGGQGVQISDEDISKYRQTLLQSDFNTQIKPVIESFFKDLKTSNFLKNYLKTHASFNYGKYKDPLLKSLKDLFEAEQIDYKEELKRIAAQKKEEEARIAAQKEEEARQAAERKAAEDLAKKEEEARKQKEEEDAKIAAEEAIKIQKQKEEEARQAAEKKAAEDLAKKEEEERKQKEEDAKRALQIKEQREAEEKLKRDQDALQAIQNKLNELKTEPVVNKKEEVKLETEKQKDKEIVKKDETKIDIIKANELNVPVQDISPLEKIVEALNALVDPFLKQDKDADIKNSYMDLLEVLSKVASKNSEDMELKVDQSDVDAYFDKLIDLIKESNSVETSKIKSLELLYAENLGIVLTERSKLRRAMVSDKKLKISDEKLIKHGPAVPVDIDQEFRDALGAL